MNHAVLVMEKYWPAKVICDFMEDPKLNTGKSNMDFPEESRWHQAIADVSDFESNNKSLEFFAMVWIICYPLPVTSESCTASKVLKSWETSS